MIYINDIALNMSGLKNTDGKSSAYGEQGKRSIISCLMLINFNAILNSPGNTLILFFSTTVERNTSLSKSVIQLQSIKLDLFKKNESILPLTGRKIIALALFKLHLKIISQSFTKIRNLYLTSPSIVAQNGEILNQQLRYGTVTVIKHIAVSKRKYNRHLHQGTKRLNCKREWKK